MITIITKWYCPYCHGALRILKQLGVKYNNIDITFKPKLYKQVQSITNFHTVPQVFVWDIHGKFLWGYTQLNNLNKSWELEKIIKET